MSAPDNCDVLAVSVLDHRDVVGGERGIDLPRPAVDDDQRRELVAAQPIDLQPALRIRRSRRRHLIRRATVSF
jgi:hypothetical protein